MKSIYNGSCILAALLALAAFATPLHAQTKVLFVGGQEEPTQGSDADVITYLEEKYGAANVTYISSDNSTSEDAEAVDLVVISSTPGSGSLRGKFEAISTPSLNWEEALVDQPRGGNWPYTEGSRNKSPEENLVIIDADHPISKALGVPTGPLAVFTEDTGKTWSASGPLPDDAFIIADTQTAADGGEGGSGAVFGVDVGGSLFDDANGDPFVATARNIQFAMEDDSAANLTDIGWQLFGACLDWLTDDLGGGGQIFDFNEDPDLEIISSTDTTEWRASGGVDNSGYLSLTDNVGGADATIIFPPVEDPISAFKISVDARIGGGTERPADGFSINIVRPEDPLLQDPRGDGYDGEFPQLGGLQEEGSQTGLGIGFDTWDNGTATGDDEADMVGFSIRVDGLLVQQIPTETPNGEPDDVTSLQTGPLSDDPDDPFAALSWQKFEVELTEDSNLNITWKGQKVLEDFSVDWFPSGNMQIVMGARTGGANEAHHFDNLSLEIVTTNTARVSGVSRSRLGVTYTIDNTEESQVDEGSIALSIDGAAVSPTITKEGNQFTIAYAPDAPWEFGSIHPWTLTAVDQNGLDVGGSGEIKVQTPTLPLTPLPGPTGGDGVAGVRYIWGAGALSSLKVATDTAVAVEEAGFEGQLLDTEDEVINHGSGGGSDIFLDEIPFPEDLEGDDLWTSDDYLQLAKGTIRIPTTGDYTFGYNTDDGAGLRIWGATFTEKGGGGQIDPIAPNSLVFKGTTGNTNTRGFIPNMQAGDYDLEFIWFERGGGDKGELYYAAGKHLNVEDTDTWELVGVGDVQWVGAPLPVPEITSVSAADSVVIGFNTPDAEANHVLQQSLDLIAWTDIADAALDPAGDAFQFSSAKPGDPATFYRVGILPPPPIFEDGFENGAEGWETTTLAGETMWELGTPSDGPGAAFAGDNVYGTDLDAPYTANTQAALRSPVVDLTGVVRPKLSFSYFIDSTLESEGVQLKYLDADGNELFTEENIFWGQSDGWLEFRKTVPSSVQDQPIRVEFTLLTDGDDGGHAGFYLDNFSIDD